MGIKSKVMGTSEGKAADKGSKVKSAAGGSGGMRKAGSRSRLNGDLTGLLSFGANGYFSADIKSA